MFTLGRKIDVSYKPNLVIILSVLIVAVGGWLFTGEMWTGFSLGVGVFLTWALSRELDPSHDYSAFIAAAFSLFMLLAIESIQFLPLFWLLLLLRAVNGISGKALTVLDLVLLGLFTGFLSWNNENPVYLFLFVLAMVFVRHTNKQTKKATIAGVLGLVFFLIQTLFVHSLPVNTLASLSTLNYFVLAAALLSPILFSFLAQGDMEDDQGKPADRSKIFASQVLYSISLLVFTFFAEMGLANQIIYLALILGVFVYFIYDSLLVK